MKYGTFGCSQFSFVVVVVENWKIDVGDARISLKESDDQRIIWDDRTNMCSSM